ncbi:MAG: arsinothricin resistance N-acetyltransferase ArsN1 family A [Gaiellaceae bacterium]
MTDPISSHQKPRARARAAGPEDAEAIARIYNQGIEDRTATFETEPRSHEDVLAWLAQGFPLLVAIDTDGSVGAWASAPPYRTRPCYDGVREVSVYVQRDRRLRGLGRLVLAALAAECERRGHWKLVSRIFPENGPSLALCRSLGFREVGVYHRHARLDGRWRDCVIVELLLAEAAT